MPCSGGPNDYEHCNFRSHAELKRDLDNTTRLLCDTCKMLEYSNLANFMSLELKAWWEHHKILDKERVNASPEKNNPFVRQNE